MHENSLFSLPKGRLFTNSRTTKKSFFNNNSSLQNNNFPQYPGCKESAEKPAASDTANNRQSRTERVRELTKRKKDFK